MKECLTGLVSLNQFAFVPGRRISDNILLTQELMHNYHLDRGPPRCAFKVDIQKAYDTVDWEFLKSVLVGFGFHPRMIGWIMKCITSTSFSLSINGTLHGYFKGKIGLRQVCFTYHPQCSKLHIINLCFTDDLFLFAHGDVDSACVIMDSLDEFKNDSGLTPNLPKSISYFCNVLNYVKIGILSVLPFEEGKLPVKYLGVPLVPSRLIYRDYTELVEKVTKRISDWKNKSLSFASGLSGSTAISYEGVLFGKSPYIVKCLGDGGKFFKFARWFVNTFGIGLGMVRRSLSGLIIDWPVKFSSVSSIIVMHLPNTADGLCWKNMSIADSYFSVVVAWECIRPRAIEVWKQLISFICMPNVLVPLSLIVDFLNLLANKRTTRSVIVKLVFAASCYFIWQERNNRLFSKQKRSEDQVIEAIKSTVRLKLLSCKFKKTKNVQMYLHQWELPNSLLSSSPC
nr:hypothetical protein [Tanacetum cinerariifolium]